MNGVVYLHSILDNRMRGTSLTNLLMMQQLAGKDGRLRNVALVTTMWDRLANKVEGVKMEKMFKDQFWNEMIAFGASVGRIEDHNDRNAYMRIVEPVMKNNGITLQIQEETVDQQLPLGETSAGKIVLDQVNKLSEKWQKDMAHINEELRKAREGADLQANQMEKLLKKQKEELQEEIRLAGLDRENLRKTITDLARDKEDLASLLDQLKLEKKKEEKHTAPPPPPSPGAPSPNQQTTGQAHQQSATTSFSSTLYQTLEEGDRHSYYFLALAFSPDGKFLVSGNNQGFIRLWDVSTGSPRQYTTASDGDYTANIESLAFSPDGNFVWASDRQGRVWRWPFNTKTGSSTYAHCHRLSELTARDFALSPDGKLFAAAGQIWYIPTRARRGTFEGTGPVAFSPDSNFIASLSWSPYLTNYKANIIGIWDTSDCSKQKELMVHSDAINSIQFSPDGKFVASGSNDQTVRFWEWENTGRQGIIGKGSINCIAFSPNGRLLAAASHQAGKIWVFDVTTRSQRAEFQGYFFSDRGIAFSPDSTLLAATVNESDSRNNYRVKIWRLSYI